MNAQEKFSNEKKYVLSIVEGLLADARMKFRQERDGLSDTTDKDIDDWFSRNASFCNEDNKQITIPVNGDRHLDLQDYAPRSFYRIPNNAAALLQFRTGVRRAYVTRSATPRNNPKPLAKPKGVPIEPIIKEMEVEVERYWFNRTMAREDYENAVTNLPARKEYYQKWAAIAEKVGNREITLKSLVGEFHTLPSSRDLEGRVRDAKNGIQDAEKWLVSRREHIRDTYPSLYKEMFEEVSA
jgi:hypothetical protein